MFGKYRIKGKRISEISESAAMSYVCYNKLVRWRWLIGSGALNEACVFHLCKMVESVLNDSIVQYIRLRMGIPMPEYYKERYNEKGDYIIRTTKKMEVAFNKYSTNTYNNRQLKKVSTGDLSQVIHTLIYRGDCCDDNMTECLMKEEFALLLKEIAKIRGATTHANIEITKDIVLKLIGLVNTLIDEYVESLQNAKRICFDKSLQIKERTYFKRRLCLDLVKWEGGVPECSPEFTEIHCSSLDYLTIRMERLVTIDKYRRRLNERELISSDSYIVEDGWTEMKEDEITLRI